MSNTNVLTGLVEVEAGRAKAAAEKKIAAIEEKRKEYAARAASFRSAKIADYRVRCSLSFWGFRRRRSKWSDDAVWDHLCDYYNEAFGSHIAQCYADRTYSAGHAYSHQLHLCQDVIRAADVAKPEMDQVGADTFLIVKPATLYLSLETVRDIGL